MATASQDAGGHKFKGCSSINQYDVLDKLGEGTFGEVHRARAKADGAVVALKKIIMHNEKDGFPITALREIKLLKMLSHINVLRLEEMAVERPKVKERKKAIMYMVTPYMDHDLSGLLENPDVNFSEAQIKCYMLQLLEGVRYLHDSHILHRDMKAANLLINNKGILQIADFGLARHYDEPVPQPGSGGGEARREYTTLVVTRWYRPPELLLQLRKYTTAIDMWGVGCVFGEMFKRQPILAGKSDLNQIQIIFDLVGSPTEENMPGWSSLPGCEGVKSFPARTGNLQQVFREQGSAFISLLSELLKLDWRKRINAIDALKHPYFTNPPYPAKPHELPTYEDSHELDKRRFRGQKAAPPPAPAGGTVGMGPNGEWYGGPNAGGFVSGPPSRDLNIGSYPPDRGPPPDRRRPQGPGPTSNANRGGWQRQDGPRPPPNDNRPGDPTSNGGWGANPRNGKDTYIPPYSDGGAGARAPRYNNNNRDPPPDAADRQRYHRERDSVRAMDRDRRPPGLPERPPAPRGDRAAPHGERGHEAGLEYGEQGRKRTRSRSPEGERRERERERARQKERERELYRR